MSHKSTILFCFAAGILALPLMASSVTYTYTGSDFQSASSPYSTSDFVSGFFTLPAALGDNLVDDSITPTSYSFSDGVQTISSASPPPDVTFEVSTDASGNINGWFINLLFLSPFDEISTETTPNQEDFGTSSGGEGLEFDEAGTWVMTGGGTSTVPEPGNLGLIGIGLVSIGLIGRKSRQHIS